MLLFQRCLATITIKIYWTYRIITGSLDDDYTISSTPKKKSFKNPKKIEFHTISKQTLQAKLPAILFSKFALKKTRGKKCRDVGAGWFIGSFDDRSH